VWVWRGEGRREGERVKADAVPMNEIASEIVMRMPHRAIKSNAISGGIDAN